MRKYLFLFLFPISSALALFVGNPAEPEMIEEGFFLSKENLFGVKIGYEGDYVFNRMLKAEGGAKGRMDTFQIGLNQGVLTFNVLDRFEAYGSIGAMSATFSHRPGVDHKRREYQTRDHLTGGAGARLILFQRKNTVIGAMGAYQYAKPRVIWNTVDGESFSTHANLTYREWQVAGSVSHQIDIFTPYISLTYSSVHAKLSGLRSNLGLHHSRFKMVSRERWGMALGCTLSNAKRFDLTGEVRLFDEQAISIAGNIEF